MRYALLGPPNVGKSSLFYALTGIYVKTANYPGTTIEVHRGLLRRGDIEIVDLPGVLHPDNPTDLDEKIALREALEGDYDGVVVVAAPHAFKEALALARTVARSKPVIFVYNMYDVAPLSIPAEELSRKLSMPVVYTSAAKRLGLDKLVDLMRRGPPPSRPGEAADFEVPASYAIRGRIFSSTPLAAATLILMGLGTLLLLLAAMEGVTPLGEIPYAAMPLWDRLSEAVADYIKAAVPNEVLASFLADGVWNAASTLVSISIYVLTALSLVVFYEESGLIGLLTSRLERALAKLGVPPRGVVCLLVGASCNVPAVASARVLWGSDNRKITALLAPYMPCAARLAIFTAVASAALANTPYLIPLAVFLPYAVAFLAVFAASKLYQLGLGVRLAPSGEVPPAPLLMPNLRIYAVKIAVELREFLRKVGLLLFLTVLAIWPLTSFGPSGFTGDASSSYLALLGRYLEPLFRPMGIPWNVVAGLLAGWIFKELVLGIMAGTGALQTLSSLPLPSVLAALVFMAFYSACIATLSSLYRTVGLRLTAISAAVQLALAYLFAYAVYLAASSV